MFSIRCIAFCLLLWVCLLGGCSESTPEPIPTQEKTVEPVPHQEATPDPSISTPNFTIAEEPLQAREFVIPEIWIVTSRQSKRALVEYLYQPQSQEDLQRIVQQLNWVNPRLPEMILPGTMVAIPPAYLVTQAEPLAAVAAVMGIPEDLVVAANPNLDRWGLLGEGTVVALPALYIVPQDTLLSSTTRTLQTSNEALISANPELAETEDIRAGTVLVVPPKREGQP